MKKSKVPLVSFVGTSKSGKTTFIEKLIPVLRKKGLRVATIKHHHLDFEIDKAGKDTYRHSKAGSSTVVLSAPHKIALIKEVDEEMSLRDILSRYIEDTDIVIVEGYKKENIPKIEIFRHVKNAPPLSLHDKSILAIVADERLDTGIPQFSLEDIVGVARFINSLLGLGIRDFRDEDSAQETVVKKYELSPQTCPVKQSGEKNGAS